MTIEMWRGGRDAEGWKLRETEDSSITSAHSITSLDVTRAGAHGLDLGREASYSPDSKEDEDEDAVGQRLSRLNSTETVYKER